MTIHLNHKSEDSLVWETMNWEPTCHQVQQFLQLQALLIEWNEKVNLTRLLKGSDFWISHVLDSLWPLRYELNHFESSRKIIDVGTGCGFPGLAIAIALPRSEITLIDSISRKTTAVKAISQTLGLGERVSVRTERAEVIGQSISFRGNYDLAVARAVATSPVVAEYLIPLLNAQGEAWLYKGRWSTDEQIDLNNALKPLKGKIKSIESFELPEGKGMRNIVRLVSNEQCPEKFPRPIGIPAKRPLESQMLDNL
ncbi:16S rRNA (guanine(527)-N(7))-methyltransferase RsmG [Prochlorococcus marinus]|nr:16S rRNA (guanine(527)-N(7))-methyltransferase RsmG [Prochlorococcus marinus]